MRFIREGKASLRHFPALIAVASLMVGAVAGSSQSVTPRQAWTEYQGKLASRCQAKQLQWLSPSELSDLVDGFTHTLTPAGQKAIQRAEDRSCRNVDMGATCGNTGFLLAAIRMRQMDAFVGEVCAERKYCTGSSTCSEIK